jgi:class 3 adenylate cyclase
LDVAAWLRGLGLAQYERAVLDQDIDADVLPQLIGEDLVAIGVASVGHRRKLLAAIAALQEPLPLPSGAAAPPAREAERRQLTVLFCDLVGSTELSRRLDPEDMGGIIRTYHHSAAAVIERWGGHLAKYKEAVAHLRQGLDALALLPPGRERDLFELDLQIALGTRLTALSGWTAPDVVRAWTRARELCELSGDTQRRATVLWGQSVVQYVGADFATAVQTGEELLHFARARGQLVELVIAHRTLGHILTHIARFEQARWHLEQTAAIGARAEAGTFAGHAYEPVVASHTYLARCLLHSGWPEQSAQLLERALAEADRLAHLPTVAFVLLQVIELGYERRQPELTRAAVERLIPLAREQGYSQWLAMAVAMEGWLTALAGEPGAGCAAIRQGQEAWEGPGNLLMRPFFFCLLADAHIHGEEAEEALRAVADGLAFIASNGEVLWEPELHRLGGEAWLLLLHGHDQAQACYTRALEVARGQEARLSELRAATALARLWARQGRRLAARDLLAPLYAWFSEGFETPDLADANMVLDELA